MKTVLVTGSNRGLGLEFTKQYVDDGWRVFACCRHPEQAGELSALAKAHPQRVIPRRLDVGDFDRLQHIADELRDQPIDVLINNAGVYGTRKSVLGSIDYAEWHRMLWINSIAPLKIAETFLPHILKGQEKKIVTITSKMGSMGDNGSGGAYAYRATKAAVNAVMVSLARDLEGRGVAVGIVHPGWVQTDMGGPNALIDAPTSVGHMRNTIEELTLANSGQFVNYDGKPIPW